MADEKLGALTTRDLSTLSGESGNLDLFATRGFQDFLVDLPDPGIPFELEHTLSPALPTGVRYEVLQATFPTVLYHDPEDQWTPGYVVLRATSGGAQIRVRLTVDDGDATPIQEAIDLSVATGFQVPDKLGSLSTNPTAEDAALGLDFGAGFDFAQNASHYGPSVELGDDAAGMGWDISADMFGYSASRKRLRFIPKTESSTYRFAAQIAQADTPVAGEYFLTGGPGGPGGLLYLGAPTAKLGTGYRIAGIYANAADVAGTVTLQNIQFPATQAASSDANNLDDYEEGSFTPSLVSSGGGTPTYSARGGTYIKVGRAINFNLQIALSGLGTLAAGTLTINGLPFQNMASNAGAVLNYFSGMATNWTAIGGFLGSGADYVFLYGMPTAAGTGYVAVTVADISGSLNVLMSGTYFVS